MKERDAYFDNIKFILIVLVVVGHLIEPINGDSILKPLYIFIYSFHMPLFIFITGYFSKNIKASDYTEKVIGNLVIPYLLFETLYSLFDYGVFQKESLVFSYFTPYWIMWFFFCMILWKVALPYVVKIKYCLPISVVIAVLAGYANDIGYYASLSRALVFFPFFLAGYYFEKRYLERFLIKPYRVIAVGAMLVLLVIFYRYGQELKVGWFQGSYSYEALGSKEWFAGVYRMVIDLLAVFLGIGILILVPQKKIPLVSDMGKNTLYTYLIHGFIIKTLIFSGFYNYLNTTAERLLLLVLGIAMAFLLSANWVRTVFGWLIEPKLGSFFPKRDQENIHL